jgi:hypothetical protein
LIFLALRDFRIAIRDPRIALLTAAGTCNVFDRRKNEGVSRSHSLRFLASESF